MPSGTVGRSQRCGVSLMIAAGRTVIIVSHRLSMLTDANEILVIDRGQIVDVDHHDRLLSKCTIYRHLWNQQTKQIA